ncbi:hypothetical protein PT274_03395 [Leuconostocaceae bacterium ESL0958]|nr:hypothetical protein [Leuconostocaceae bacterium ESL0958]
MRLKDIRQIAYQYQVATAKLDDGQIYELREDCLISRQPELAVIANREHEIRRKLSLSQNWERIQSIKVGHRMLAIRDRKGSLVQKEN